MHRDYYQVLGLARRATPAEIRAAYARLVRLHHPDITGDLTVRLADLREAYRCLANDEARAAHDQRLAEADRLHLARQRRVAQRLYRYDRRHPRLQPRHPWRWPRLVSAAAAVALLAGVSFRLLG